MTDRKGVCMYRAEFLTEQEYRKILENEFDQVRYTFTQQPDYGRAKSDEGNRIEYLVVKSDNHFAGLALIVYYSKFKFFYRAEALGGPIVKDEFLKDYNQILTAMKKCVLKDFRTLEFRINPLIQKNKYENIEIVESEINKDLEEKIIEAGFERINKEFFEDPSLQRRFVYTLNIKDQSYDEVIANLDVKLRNKMRKAKSLNLQIKYIGLDEADEFIELLEETYSRIDTDEVVRKEFIKNLMREYQENLLVPIVYIDCDKTIQTIDENEKELTEELEHAKRGKASDLKDMIHSQRNLRKKVLNLKEERGNLINLYGSMFIQTNKELIYFFSGGPGDLLFLNGAVYIHLEMLAHAVKEKLEIYNLYGISGIFDPSAPDYGVLKFKEDFNGQVEEYIGTYETKKFQ